MLFEIMVLPPWNNIFTHLVCVHHYLLRHAYSLSSFLKRTNEFLFFITWIFYSSFSINLSNRKYVQMVIVKIIFHFIHVEVEELLRMWNFFFRLIKESTSGFKIWVLEFSKHLLNVIEAQINLKLPLLIDSS